MTLAEIYEQLSATDKRLIFKAIREHSNEITVDNGYWKIATERDFGKLPFLDADHVRSCLIRYSNNFQISSPDCNVERFREIRRITRLIEDKILKQTEKLQRPLDTDWWDDC